jgi:hypothetical protein
MVTGISVRGNAAVRSDAEKSRQGIDVFAWLTDRIHTPIAIISVE